MASFLIRMSCRTGIRSCFLLVFSVTVGSDCVFSSALDMPSFAFASFFAVGCPAEAVLESLLRKSVISRCLDLEALFG